MIGCWVSGMKAQSTDLFQVIPFKAEPGLTTDDGFMISFQLNSSQAYWGIQFEMKLPEGMTLDDTDGADPFELSMDRFPYTKRGSKVTFKHGVAYGKRKDDPSWYIVVISPNDNTSYISEGNGECFYAYVKTDANMKPGVYPIYIRAALMVVTTSLYTRPAATTSYCKIGDATLPQTSKVSLPDFTGQIPSWVVTDLSQELNHNTALRELDLPNVDMLDADFQLANPNTLVYVNAESKYAQQLAGRETPLNNVVAVSDENATCRSLYLDERYGFNCTIPFSAERATLYRQGVSKGWNTFCLPFELKEEQVKNVWGENSQVQHFTSFNDNIIRFESTHEMTEAYTPCLLYVDEDKSNANWTFDNVSVCATSLTPSVVNNGVSFMGNLNGRISAQGLYGITSDNMLKIGGANAHINGFRSYFDLSPNINAQSVQLVYGGEVTSIGEVKQNMKMQRIYSIDGRSVKTPMQRGVYIINNQKVFVK